MFAPRSSRPVTVVAVPSKNRLRRKKKGENAAPAISLERILGLTTTKNTGISIAGDLVAYAAGSVVVLYNHKKNKQIGFLHASSTASPTPPSQIPTNTAPSWSGAFQNRHTIANDGFSNPLMNSLGILDPTAAVGASSAANSPKTAVSNKAKPISCLAFSPDGNYLAVGETGHQPRILIWDVLTKTLVNELKGHKYGVLALAFSPNMKYVVSLGFQHDGYLNVWNWKQGIKLACNKVTTKVHTIAFNRSGSYFVTVGLRHVKFWYFDANGNLPKKPAGQSIQKSLVQVLDGRSGILGDLRDHNFVDAVCCPKSEHTYFVTSNGLLCMFTEGRMMDKWVELQVKGAYSIDVSEQYIVCACTNGIIRLFEPITLKYLGTLPKPHPLGVDLSLQTGNTYQGNSNPDDTYPDTIAVKLDQETGKLTCVYSDRSIFIWDIKDSKKIGKYRSFLYHCDCIWGVEMIPNRDSETQALPENTFVTYSADGTIRFWNLDGSTNNNSIQSPTHIDAINPLSPVTTSGGGPSIGVRRNIYSKECLKMVYVDQDGTFRMSATGGNPSVQELTDPLSSESGIRVLKISPDGKLMASGDRGGNLRVHDLDTFREITYQEAHDAEILSIEFSDGRATEAPYLIATASRDRILHIFDINNNFQLIQTLGDHSSSITAVKFTNDGGRLISCGADKSIIFRSRQNSNDVPYYVTYHNISGRATVFDMDIDVSNRYIATVSGERRLNIYHIDSGKNVRSHKSDTPDEINTPDQGSLLKVNLDPGGVLAVAGGSDKSIRLFDFANGTILSKALGHSELITGAKFTPDCQRIVSTSADGCIFVWKISDELVAKMRKKWLDRSGGLNGTSPTSQDLLGSTPSNVQTAPRTTIPPAQRPQTMFAEVTPNQNEDGYLEGPEFVVRKLHKKSFNSLPTPENHHEDESNTSTTGSNTTSNNSTPAPTPTTTSSSSLPTVTNNSANSRRLGLKRPTSFANDGSSSTSRNRLQAHITSRPVSDISISRLPRIFPNANNGNNEASPTTPPSKGNNSSNCISPPPSRRDSWKLNIPGWAKKAFKDKEDYDGGMDQEKEGIDSDTASNSSVKSPLSSSLTTIPLVRDTSVNLDKKLPAIPRSLTNPRLKSQSKLRQESTNSLFETAKKPEISENTNVAPSETSNEGLENINSVTSETSSVLTEDELPGEESSYEDTETLFVETASDDEKYVEVHAEEDDENQETVEGDDEREDDDEEEGESGDENTKKLEMYLQSPVEQDFKKDHIIIRNEKDSGDQLVYEQKNKKRESLTYKYLSGGHQKNSSQDSSARNSLVEAFSRIFTGGRNSAENNDSTVIDECESEDRANKNAVEQALDILEGKSAGGEVVRYEDEIKSDSNINNGTINLDITTLDAVDEISSPISTPPSPLISESSTLKDIDDDNKRRIESVSSDQMNTGNAKTFSEQDDLKKEDTEISQDDDVVDSEIDIIKKNHNQESKENYDSNNASSLNIIEESIKENDNVDKGDNKELEIEMNVDSSSLTINDNEKDPVVLSPIKLENEDSLLNRSSSIVDKENLVETEGIDLNEDKIMEDVYNMTLITERMLAVYKKASNFNNENITKLISESLKGITDDIQDCFGVLVKEKVEAEDKKTIQEKSEKKELVAERKQEQKDDDKKIIVTIPQPIQHETAFEVANNISNSNLDDEDEGDADSNVSYMTALTHNHESSTVPTPSHARSLSTASNTNNNAFSSSPPTNSLSPSLSQTPYSDKLVEMVEEKLNLKKNNNRKNSHNSNSGNSINNPNGSGSSNSSGIVNGISFSSNNIGSGSVKGVKSRGGSIPIIGRTKTSKSRFG
ncbi:7546_t:CDS:10 [Ambispora gerdemannii]|uniref:7546_t:CDS:1 n=1 Tax=Ambispora gerdemannii TaxID=144530 RepID=A0A9N8WKV3_9GLOM|nr:7546_t:CDS:10 [Ambispora gerdemannii]